ncbi:MAG: hypothetical protein IT323_20415 [Anaerolineae bacterium]|nr:hypothetical protein [Anaerolineae bacterium]
MNKTELAIIQRLAGLNETQQQQVLAYVEGLSRLAGIPGEELLAWAEEHPMAPEDLAAMERIIEEDCERIDPDEWGKPSFPA